MANERLPEDLFDCYLKVEKEIRETEEEFVYQIISPYCENIAEKKLSKKELKNILQKGMNAELNVNKIIAEIDFQEKWLLSAGYNAYNIDIAFNSIKNRIRKELLDNGSNRNQ